MVTLLILLPWPFFLPLGFAAEQLPLGWKELHDASSGKVYYLNSQTGKTSWTLPSDSQHAAPVDACTEACIISSQSKTCAAWIKQKAAVFGVNEGRAAACQTARLSLLEECSSCDGCTVAESGCLGDEAIVHDCKDGYSDWQRLWPEAKRSWCCQRFQKGCLGASANSPYDCEAGASTTGSWSEEQKSWCCANQNRGCKFDCHSSLSTWVTDWSLDMRSWCCSHKKLGCIKPADYDCDESEDGGPSQWQEVKRHYCCHMENKGCPTSSTINIGFNDVDGQTTGKPFQCNGRDWPVAKIQWCCAVENIGCYLLLTTTPPSAVLTTTPYDCEAGLNNWRAGWSHHKQMWCCHNQQLGCPFDCKHDADHWEDVWSAQQKTWCCAHEHVGCVGMPGGMPAPEALEPSDNSFQFDCHLHLSIWPSAWSVEKKAWCCRRHRLGCPDTEQLYDCHAKDWQESRQWPSQKRDWCCRKHQTGCPYDCQAGINNAAHGWSDNKLQWCCMHQRVACDVAKTSFDCDDSHAAASWSKEQQSWCCEHRNRGCSPSAPYDCDAGTSSWQTGWSSSKQEWCCKHANLGCRTSASSDKAPVYNCNAGVSNPEHAWSFSKQAWCCRFEQKGCSDGVQYDCKAVNGAAWSDHKARWCCEHKNTGCASGPAQYDCTADAENWHDWSPGKKDHCCEHFFVGCSNSEISTTIASLDDLSVPEPPTLPPTKFDCKAGADKWQDGWSAAKKAWCCDNEGFGCTSADPYNCDAVGRREDWSEEKKVWCCNHKHAACDMLAGTGVQHGLLKKFASTRPLLERSTGMVQMVAAGFVVLLATIAAVACRRAPWTPALPLRDGGYINVPVQELAS